MAIFRKIHTSIWSDSFFSELDKEKKLFYLYLLTNQNTKQCGVYEITKRQIAFDIGTNIDRVSILLQYFIDTGKIRYNDKTCEVGIGNWLKYNSSTSPKVQSCINKEFSTIKDTLLIEYVKSMDTQQQEEQEQEQEQEQEPEKNNIVFDLFWDLYDKKVGDKNACIRKWNKLTPEQQKKILEILPEFKEQFKDKQFQPYPATFLNQERWNDEVVTKKLNLL